MLHINFIAVILAAVAAFIIGFMFHGPLLGKMWMRLAKIVPTGNEKLSDMRGQMFANLVSNFVTALALAVVYALSSASPIMSFSPAINGVIIALIAWLGFLVTSSSIEVIWMGRSYKLWLFECFSSLVTMLAMGIIITIY